MVRKGVIYAKERRKHLQEEGRAMGRADNVFRVFAGRQEISVGLRKDVWRGKKKTG
jgi:hypothetical protein